MEENKKVEETLEKSINDSKEMEKPVNDFQEILDKAKSLENIDFKTVEDFDYTEYYSIIEKIAKKNVTLKNEEAENLVKEFAEKLIDKNYVTTLNDKKENILNFLRKYDPNTDIIKNMVEHDVDKVYAVSNYLVNSYIQYLNEMSFNFELSNKDYKFLNKILTQLIEYNGDDVFNYVELYENFWINVREYVDKNAPQEVYYFKVNIKMILILHHLIKNFKVKGNTDEFKCFRNILYRIAQTNKLFNAYNIIVERIKEDCKIWGAALDETIRVREEGVKVIEENKQTQESQQ